MRFDENGRLEMETVPDSEDAIPADTVIFAIGQAPDLGVLAGTDGLKTTKRGMIAVDADTLETGVPGVFAGGDAIAMTGSVIGAIACGKKAAASIDRYLGGTGIQHGEEDRKSVKPIGKFNSLYLQKTSRVNAPEIPVTERIRNIDVECACGLDTSAVEMEANRCFNCGCVAVNPSDMAPTLIALEATIKTTKRVIEAEKFFTVDGNRTTVLDDDEIVVEIKVPALSSGAKCKFLKSAIRKSIDFPLVNCAAAIKSEQGIVKSARICLNSVYTQPYRVTKAEKFIKGKSIDVSTAEAAANEITADTIPLLNNRYKIQIARALIKRVILACC
jgi:CO/xanthine dehydrogenase FAD-binding subunit